MSPRGKARCSRCGVRPGTIPLPIGALCSKCRFALAYHPEACPECTQLRPLGYHSARTAGVIVCASCACEVSVFACRQCGREDHPYSLDRCARCVLADRLTVLLTDPATGRVHRRLQPL